MEPEPIGRAYIIDPDMGHEISLKVAKYLARCYSEIALKRAHFQCADVYILKSPDEVFLVVWIQYHGRTATIWVSSTMYDVRDALVIFDNIWDIENQRRC
ncbi:MAG: hypothetical protein Q6351_007725 [Candidatus Njordarchaeum guaymaensis]